MVPASILSGLAVLVRAVDVPGLPVDLVAVDGGVDAVLASSNTGVELVRVDPGTGRIPARARVPKTPTDPLVLAGGLLWFGTRDPQAGPTTLLGYDPTSLVPRRTARLPGPAFSLAAAGGLLWAVVGNQLVGIDPATAAITHTVALPTTGALSRGETARVAGAPDGAVLWTVEIPDGGGNLSVQTRDPHTGAVTAAGTLTVGGLSVGTPAATGTGVWVPVPTGMLGYAVQITHTSAGFTLTPVADRPGGTNSLQVSLAAGALWVSDLMVGGLTCADPTGGARRAATRQSDLNLSDDVVQVGPNEIALGAGSQDLSGPHQILLATPTPACRGQH